MSRIWMRSTLSLALLPACYGTLHDARLDALAAWQRGDRVAACAAGQRLEAAWEAAGSRVDEAEVSALVDALEATPVAPTAPGTTRRSALSDLAPVDLERDLVARLTSTEAADLLPALRAVGSLRLARFAPLLIEVLAGDRPHSDQTGLTRPATRAPIARALAREALCGLARPTQ